MKPRLLLYLLTLALAWGCGTDAGTAGKDQAPAPPSQLRAEKFSDGEVILSWEASPDEQTQAYVIYRADGDHRLFARIAATAETRFRDTGLDYETAYFYRVVAVNGAGVESLSLNLSGRPLNNLWPATVTHLQAEARNLEMLGFDPEIELSWEASPEADLAVYRVYGSTRPEFPANGNTLLAETEQPWYRQTGLDVGVTYYYKVTSVDRGGLESPVPAPARVELIPPPVLQQPIRGIYAADEKPLFVWQAQLAPRAGSRVRYTVSLTDGPAARELWAEQMQDSDTRMRYTGRTLAEGTYWWKVLVEVVDERDRVESLSLSPLGHFRVR